MTGWGSEEVAYRMETDEPDYVSDSEVSDWVIERRKLKLYVCSGCGLICSELIQHEPCHLQDWWHLDVKCIDPVRDKIRKLLNEEKAVGK